MSFRYGYWKCGTIRLLLYPEGPLICLLKGRRWHTITGITHHHWYYTPSHVLHTICRLYYIPSFVLRTRFCTDYTPPLVLTTF